MFGKDRLQSGHVTKEGEMKFGGQICFVLLIIAIVAPNVLAQMSVEKDPSR
jgi:hypothetical protein